MKQSQQEQSKQRKGFELRKNLKWIIPVLVCLIVSVYFGLTALIRCRYPEIEESGQVGDSFGAVNALFSGLAFAGVVIAILLQSEDLRAQEHAMELQTKEMKDTTEALEAQTNLLDAQVRHSGRQEFDARFFETVRFIRSSFDQLDVLFTNQNSFRGAAAVSQLSGTLRNTMLPKLDPALFRGQFAKFERDYGRHYQPALQMLEIGLQMLITNPQTRFHGSYFKASFSAEEKWLFCHVLLFSRKQLESPLKEIIERLSFFEGIDSRIAQLDTLGLADSAFGIVDAEAEP
jgi:hypothetical protein